MSIKKIKSFLFIAFLLQINVAYITAAEEKQSDNFQDAIMNNFQTNFAPLRKGFELIGLNYDAFLENKRDLIPETNSDLLIEDYDSVDYMHEIVVAAEAIIIDRMQKLLKQGFTVAIKNHTDVDELTMKLFDYVIDYEPSLGCVILQHLTSVPNVLIQAVYHNNIQIVNMLIEAEVDINARDNYGETALITAAHCGLLTIVEKLIAVGVDVNAHNNNGETALMFAVWKGYLEIVEKLIAVGANVNAHNNNGETALMLAARKGCLEIAEKLITAGADVNAHNNNGLTALMFAAQNNNATVIQILITAGADINIHDIHEIAALSISYQEMKSVILQAVAQRDNPSLPDAKCSIC